MGQAQMNQTNQSNKKTIKLDSGLNWLKNPRQYQKKHLVPMPWRPKGNKGFSLNAKVQSSLPPASLSSPWSSMQLQMKTVRWDCLILRKRKLKILFNKIKKFKKEKRKRKKKERGAIGGGLSNRILTDSLLSTKKKNRTGLSFQKEKKKEKEREKTRNSEFFATEEEERERIEAAGDTQRSRLRLATLPILLLTCAIALAVTTKRAMEIVRRPPVSVSIWPRDSPWPAHPIRSSKTLAPSLFPTSWERAGDDRFQFLEREWILEREGECVL